MEWNIWTTVFACLFFLRNGFELGLDFLQDNHLKNRRDKVPKHLDGKVDIETIRKAVVYNRDKLHFAMAGRLHGTVAIWVMILFGFGWLDRFVGGFDLGTVAGGLAFFGLLSVVSFVWDLPLELISIFGIESRHGFNRQSFKGFIGDKLKEIPVSIILGAILATLVLLLMEKGGSSWWIYAFLGVTGFQLLVAWLYPLLIMPLFNRFTPVDSGLAQAVAGLAQKVGFPLKGVMSMDGSKRSAHSNAFIVGLKGARRIVLFDTLMNRIRQSELIAVLAHELGHFKLNHLRRRLVMVAVSLIALFAGLAYLREQTATYTGFGFSGRSDHAALIVFALLIGEVLAPFGWIFRYLSRRDEFAADRFSVEAVQNGYDLKEALIALTKQNLASPGSHKLYRSYHNSHPPLRQRLAAIRNHAKKKGFSLKSDDSEIHGPVSPE